MPKSRTQGDSTFQVSGENGGVEGLRIENPLPGTWTVQITSAPGVPPLDVSTVVMYQAAVRSSMTVNPEAPQAGQEVTVALSLQTRSRSITDPAALKDLAFTADLTGDGFTTPVHDRGGGAVPAGRASLTGALRTATGCRAGATRPSGAKVGA